MARKEGTPVNTHTLLRKPGELLEAQKAAGPCPYCGRLDHWLNDIPLKAFCWGTESDPHREWTKIVPKPFNPYLPGYDKTARAALPGPVEDRTAPKGGRRAEARKGAAI